MSDNFEAKLNKVVWRKPATRKKAKRIPFRKLWWPAGIFLILLALAGAIFVSPVLKIKNIDVSGNTSLSRQDIELFVRSYSGYNPLISGNILFLDGTALAEKMKSEFPIIDSATVGKNFLKRSITVGITEKKSIGIWCDSSQCFYLEKNGTVFEQAPFSEGTLILLVKSPKTEISPKLGEKVMDGDLLNFLLDVKSGLFSRLNLNIDEFTLKPGVSDVEVAIAGGFKIYFDSVQSPETQIANLKILLEQKIQSNRSNLEYVDLRSGNRIYYKLKDGTVNPAANATSSPAAKR